MIKICVININTYKSIDDSPPGLMSLTEHHFHPALPVLLRTDSVLDSSQFPNWRPAGRVLIKDVKFGADNALTGFQVDQLLLSNSPVVLSSP